MSGTNSELEQLKALVENHLEDYKKHVADYHEREDKLMRAQELNTEHIRALTEATKGLVDAWNAANLLQRFIKWLSGFAGLALIAGWAYTTLKYLLGK